MNSVATGKIQGPVNLQGGGIYRHHSPNVFLVVITSNSHSQTDIFNIFFQKVRVPSKWPVFWESPHSFAKCNQLGRLLSAGSRVSKCVHHTSVFCFKFNFSRLNTHSGKYLSCMFEFPGLAWGSEDTKSLFAGRPGVEVGSIGHKLLSEWYTTKNACKFRFKLQI